MRLRLLRQPFWVHEPFQPPVAAGFSFGPLFGVVSTSMQRALGDVLAVDEWLPPLLRVDLALGVCALLPLVLAWRVRASPRMPR